MTPMERRIATLNRIVSEAAADAGVSPKDILGQSRLRTVTEARKQCYRALSKEGYSSSKIGQMMGRDHTTVLYGIGRVKKAQRQ